MTTSPRGRWLAVAAGTALSVLCVTLAPPALALAPGDPAVDALLESRLANPRMGSDVGLVVLDAASGAVVADHEADALMLPASNMKIVTAVNALSTMGRDARFATRVLAGSAPNDIVLRGGGDPLLARADLEALAEKAASALTKDSKVVVHVDTSLFPAPGKGPGWTDGYLPWVATPVVPLARLGYYGPDPQGDAARAFAGHLRSLGYRVKVGSPVATGSAATVLAEVSPHTLGDAVGVMLSRSENNIAEVLYRHVALATGREASWDGARAAAEENLTKLGLDPERMRLLDGSGLSRKDRLSPRFLAEVLRFARVTTPDPYRVMFERQALPVSGQTGTLATAYGRYVTRQSRCARGDVHAKTGSLFDTISLSGTARTTQGSERLFAIFVNHRPQQYSALSARQVLDGLTATITGCWD